MIFSMAEERCVCIKDLRPGMKSVTSTFIVIDKGWYILFQNKTKRTSVRVFSAVCSDAAQKMAAWLESAA